jgi:hypothetical protein
MIARLTEYNAVMTRIPDRSAFTFNLVCMIAVIAPAIAPEINTKGKTINTD